MYHYREEEIEGIGAARKKNKDKQVEVRLKALELRARGGSAKEVAQATGFHPSYITTLVAKYQEERPDYLLENH